MRRVVTAAVAVAAVLPSGASGASEGFSDVAGGHAYGIEQVARWGIDEGCGDGRFCPDEPISRAEMAAWLYRAVTRLNATPLPVVEGPGFADVPDGAWYLTYARWATANGIIAADGGTFNPAGTVTRANAAAMLVAAFSHLAAADPVEGVFADTGHLPQAAMEAIEGIHAAGLTKGCATGPLRYCPHRAITRAQAAVMLARAIQRAEPTVGLIVNEPEAARGYTLINTRLSDEVYLIDHLGRKVHNWRLEGYSIRLIKLLETGNLMIFHNKGDQSLWMAEVDTASNTVWEYPAADAHHDFLVLPNGNLLLLMNDEITPQEAIAAGADPKRAPLVGWKYHYLQEVKPTGPNGGEIVWEWSTLDHLIQDHDPDKPNYGPIAGHPGRIDINYALRHKQIGQDREHDWIHMNAIDYNPVLDQIMLSARNFSELWIINHNTTTEEAAEEKGDLLYRWGNPRAHGAGGYQDQQLFWQHYSHWIPLGLPGAGNVLIFNNGNEFTGLRRYYSTVDEIALPASEGDAYPRNAGGSAFAPARPQWIHITDKFAPWASSAQRLPNGNTLICNGDEYLVQVAPDGTTVWKYVNPMPVDGPPAYQGDNARSGVTCRTPWYPSDYPGLRGMDLTPQGPIELYR